MFNDLETEIEQKHEYFGKVCLRLRYKSYTYSAFFA